MGFIKIEKATSHKGGKYFGDINNIKEFDDYYNNNQQPYNNYVEEKDAYIASLNSQKEEYVEKTANSEGMNNGRIKVERDIITSCLSTFIKIIIISASLIALLYLGFHYLDNKVELFPYQSSYTAKEFNEYLRRSFILLFVLLSFGCSLLMLIINNIVTKQFKKHYLSKINVYIYEIFTIIINIAIYVLGAWCMFILIDKLYDKFVFWQSAGTIIGSVNIEIINLFKYVITSVVAVFIVINSFSICNIVHKNNKFVFENV